MDAACSTDYFVMGEAEDLPEVVAKTTLKRREGLCNTLFAMSIGFGQGHSGGHIDLAAWAGLRAMSSAQFPLSIEYIHILP